MKENNRLRFVSDANPFKVLTQDMLAMVLEYLDFNDAQSIALTSKDANQSLKSSLHRMSEFAESNPSAFARMALIKDAKNLALCLKQVYGNIEHQLLRDWIHELGNKPSQIEALLVACKDRLSQALEEVTRKQDKTNNYTLHQLAGLPLRDSQVQLVSFVGIVFLINIVMYANWDKPDLFSKTVLTLSLLFLDTFIARKTPAFLSNLMQEDPLISARNELLKATNKSKEEQVEEFHQPVLNAAPRRDEGSDQAELLVEDDALDLPGADY